jgi:hypothetical protein
MAILTEFLRDVLFEGRISLHGTPEEEDEKALGVLRQGYAALVLRIAGPPLPLHEPTAMAAARVLARAAWYFLNPGLAIAAPEKALAMPAPPRTPAEHLSADLLLRFVPTLHRRARAVMQEDVLPQGLERLLRSWPLSGVLSDITEPPLTAVDFGDHVGVNLLYAERLARLPRAGWFPPGRGMQYVELVWQELGKDVSVLSALQEVAQELTDPTSSG